MGSKVTFVIMAKTNRGTGTSRVDQSADCVFVQMIHFYKKEVLRECLSECSKFYSETTLHAQADGRSVLCLSMDEVGKIFSMLSMSLVMMTVTMMSDIYLNLNKDL